MGCGGGGEQQVKVMQDLQRVGGDGGGARGGRAGEKAGQERRRGWEAGQGRSGHAGGIRHAKHTTHADFPTLNLPPPAWPQAVSAEQQAAVRLQAAGRASMEEAAASRQQARQKEARELQVSV